MKTINQLGIYLDHASANLIDFTDNDKDTQTVISEFDIQDKHETLQRSESEMHHKEQDKQRAYFKKIATLAIGYNEIVLFGPTTAKNELLHFLQRDSKFYQNQDRSRKYAKNESSGARGFCSRPF
nr:hypothetical protein [Flavobacterium sp. ASV13]